MTPLTKAVIGADPGAKGAFFLITENRETQLFEFEGYTFDQWRNWLDDRCLVNDVVAIGIEKVGAMPGQGIASTAKFMYNAGYLHGLSDANFLPITFVMPGVWQKFHHLGGKSGPLGCTPSQEKTARKNRHKRCAQEKFPQHKVDKENADVMLIADYVWHQQFEEITLNASINDFSTIDTRPGTMRIRRRNQ